MSKEPKRVDAGVPTGGQFAKTAHSDAVPTLAALSPDPVLNAAAEAAVARRASVQEQIGDLQSQIAVESAGALAHRTRAFFPEAKYVVFRGSADTLDGLRPESIVDADGTTLASPDDGKTSEDFWGWAGDIDEEGFDVFLLSYDLEHHNGKLDGYFAPVTGLMNRYSYVSLDIDKALERTAP
jgi:hypothetical protein